ncbi:MAG: phosphotransferase [Clostridia bacterium]|nr:phosphotransferase [Clostridia bacterium]
MEYPILLYYNAEVANIQTLDLCRGDDDYRKVYIVDDGQRKLVIKHLSNTFSDERRIKGWFNLMEEYRKIGLYCPKVIPNLQGEILHCDTVEGRNYYTYAEEFSIYETAEHIGDDQCKNDQGESCFTPDVMRFLGKIAAAELSILDWPSAYCLLEPFCPPDTTDEATECAVAFVKYIKETLPQHLPRAEALLDLFYQRQEELRTIYNSLPTSCFQADLNDSNILLDENNNFVGLIDFNLCGKEPILNYAVREALWGISDNCLYGENDSCLYFYDKELDGVRIQSFLKNIRYIQENYTFSALEREAFPILFRYVNSFWWYCLDEIKLVHEDEQKVKQLLDWLEFQMVRDDIRLP